MRSATPPIYSDRVTFAAAVFGAAVAVAAVALGVFARFKGLAAAPQGVDEYFILRSTENLLHHGWPAFDCGGFYTRGLALQYLTACLSLLGVPLEQGPRLISAVSSLLALPAVFLISRRLNGVVVALLAVAIVAVSVWETELARFGRMYAPFQAVFLWYVVFYLRRSVDGDRRAEWPMIGLTVLGALLWEGGALLALANFLPLLLRRRSLLPAKDEWPSIARFAVLFLLVYGFVTADFRTLGGTPALPDGYDPSEANSPADALSTGSPLWATLRSHRLWLALFLLVPLAGCAVAVRALWLRNRADLTAIGLAAMLVAAIAHQFLLAGAIPLLLLLFRYSSWRELTAASVRPVYLAVAVCGLFWLAFSYAAIEPPSGATSSQVLFAHLYPLLSIPDFLNQVARPWARAVPLLGIGLLAFIGAAAVLVLRREEAAVSSERAVLALLICLLLAACASGAPRNETRYVFFLYPLAIIVSLNAVAALFAAGAHRRWALAATVAVCAGLFMLTEDFAPRYLLTIDRPGNLLRLHMTPGQEAHLVIRDDTPALAAWLRAHATGDAIVVSAYQSLDYYDPKVNFFYVDREDFNYASYACRHGTVDRWSNRPLLPSPAALATVIDANSSVYLVTYTTRVGALLTQLARYEPRVAWQSGHLSVVAFKAAALAAGLR